MVVNEMPTPINNDKIVATNTMISWFTSLLVKVYKPLLSNDIEYQASLLGDLVVEYSKIPVLAEAELEGKDPLGTYTKLVRVSGPSKSAFSLV
jgi:hypothetical protein